jgi:hypothetical protein
VRNNAAGRRHWWSAPGRTLEFVLDRAHRARERPRPRDATGATSDVFPPPRELLDTTPDGIRLLRLGVLRVGDKVWITVLGIDAEDR